MCVLALRPLSSLLAFLADVRFTVNFAMQFSTSMFKRFRNPKDKRDFVTAGVSVGVAAAFNAPIGGLLFAFEEVASFWQQSLGWQVGGSGSVKGGLVGKGSP